MSMILGITTVSDGTIERLHSDPQLVWQIVAPDDPEAVAEASPAHTRRGRGDLGDLEKAWHGIHYLLTGTAWKGDPPLNFLVAGGRPVGRIDVGYGPARTFESKETRTIPAALQQLSDEELRSRFSPEEMMRLSIYPEIGDRDPEEDDSLEYLMQAMTTLRQGLDTAVSRGYGVLVTIT